MDTTLRRLQLKRGEGRRVERGHLWVFSNEVETLADGAGDEVAIFSAKGAFLGSALHSPSALIRARIYSREARRFDGEYLRGRLGDALARRTSVDGSRPHSFRLCSSEGDMIPGLIVDVFGDHVVMQITTAGMDARRESIIAILVELLAPASITERSDSPQRALEGLGVRTGVVHGEAPPAPLVVEEAGVVLLADVGEGQKTGFYLDQVANREAMAALAVGRRVLDLHCHVGAWSMRLAASGAGECIGVDTSAPAIELANLAAERNGLVDRCRFVREDAGKVLQSFAEAGEKFDMVVVDPPPLARKRKDVKAALRAYADMNRRALKLLKRGGILATASCSHHVSRDDFEGALVFAARDAKVDVRVIYRGGQSADHPIHLATQETEYLKFVALEVM